MRETVFVCCACIVLPFILDVRLVDVPAGVTQEEGHTGFLIHLPSAVLALIFLSREGSSPSFPSSTVKPNFCALTTYSFSTYSAFLFIFVRKISSSCDCTGTRTHVPTSEGFKVTD